MEIFRKATASDCADAFRLVCEIEKKRLPYTEFSTIFRQQLGNKQYFWLVCESKGAVVGFLNLRCEEQLHHCSRIGEILELVVDAAYRNQGIGKLLFDWACQVAREQGCTQVEGVCGQDWEDARQLYETSGMQNTHFKLTMALDDAAEKTEAQAI